MPWLAEEMLDGQLQRVDIPDHARATHKGLLLKRLEEYLCWIVPHVIWSRDWTELSQVVWWVRISFSFTELGCWERTLCTCVWKQMWFICYYLVLFCDFFLPLVFCMCCSPDKIPSGWLGSKYQLTEFCMCGEMSASAKQRGITPQLFATWGRTQERTVAACPIRQHFVFDSVVYRRQRFKFDTAIMIQSVLLSSSQQFVDRLCQLMKVETVCFLCYHRPEVTLCCWQYT